jgi:flagellar protein FlaG
MSNITQLTTVPADLVGAQLNPRPAPATKAPSKTSAATSSPASSSSETSGDPEQRLVIKEGAQAGVFIYTILDRVTGAVLVQIPREEVVHIASRPDYSAGQVIDTKV